MIGQQQQSIIGDTDAITSKPSLGLSGALPDAPFKSYSIFQIKDFFNLLVCGGSQVELKSLCI